MTDANAKVALVVGSSRGIGRQVAIDLAKAGYTVVVAAKSTSVAENVLPFPPDPNSSESTINTVAREIVEFGGKATAIPVDVRDVKSIENLISQTVAKHKTIDVLIYNSGAIWWSSVENTPLKRFQLLQQVNPQGLYATLHCLLPVFSKQGWNARIVVVSPPIYSRFFRGKTAYAVGKVGMTVLTMGLAMDWEREGKEGMAISSIWPAVAIQSAATQAIKETDLRHLRHPTIFSDAIKAMLKAPTKTTNGLVQTDEDFLRTHCNVTDFSKYSVVPGAVPRRIMPARFPDLTVEEQNDEGDRLDSAAARRAKL